MPETVIPSAVPQAGNRKPKHYRFVDGVMPGDERINLIARHLGKALKTGVNVWAAKGMDVHAPAAVGKLFADVSGVNFGEQNAFLYELMRRLQKSEKTSWALTANSTFHTMDPFLARLAADKAQKNGLVLIAPTDNGIIVSPSTALIERLAGLGWTSPNYRRQNTLQNEKALVPSSQL